MTFLTLGILLMELCFNQTLEEHPLRRDYLTPKGQSSPQLDFAMALDWSESLAGEAGKQYADAVEWCLRKRSGVRNDEDWKDEFLEKVVRPLQRDFEYLNSSA